jgi:hypothetical protein
MGKVGLLKKEAGWPLHDSRQTSTGFGHTPPIVVSDSSAMLSVHRLTACNISSKSAVLRPEENGVFTGFAL